MQNFTTTDSSNSSRSSSNKKTVSILSTLFCICRNSFVWNEKEMISISRQSRTLHLDRVENMFKEMVCPDAYKIVISCFRVLDGISLPYRPNYRIYIRPTMQPFVLFTSNIYIYTTSSGFCSALDSTKVR